MNVKNQEKNTHRTSGKGSSGGDSGNDDSREQHSQDLRLSEPFPRSCSKGSGEVGGASKTPAPEQSKLTNYQAVIAQRVTDGLTTTRILREIKKLGYKGERTILGKMRAAFDPRLHCKNANRSNGGLRHLMDLSCRSIGPGTILIANKPAKIHVLGMVLCSSRKLFYPFIETSRRRPCWKAWQPVSNTLEVVPSDVCSTT